MFWESKTELNVSSAERGLFMSGEKDFRQAVKIAIEKGDKEIEYIVLSYTKDEIWTLETAKEYLKIVLDPEDMTDKERTFNKELKACDNLYQVALLYNSYFEDNKAKVKYFPM